MTTHLTITAIEEIADRVRRIKALRELLGILSGRRGAPMAENVHVSIEGMQHVRVALDDALKLVQTDLERHMRDLRAFNVELDDEVDLLTVRDAPAIGR